MAALAVTNPTLLDLAKHMDPDGKISVVAEILNETNEVLDDMTWIEGNLPTGNQTTVRTGIPAPTWRRIYEGVAPTKGTVAKVTDSCGMLEAYAQIDKALADLNGNTAAYRLSEDKGHIEGMSQEVAETLFYGNEGTDPAEFTGLSPRYNSLSAENAQNIVVGGGSDTDNASIWLVVWSPQTCFGLIPKGSKAGIQVTDKGQQTVQTGLGSSGAAYEAYVTHYRWDAGFCLRDWRYVVRIPNIDKSALTKDASAGADLADLMFQAIDLIPNMNAGRPVFYMSRTIRTFLRRQVANLTKNSTLQIESVGGKRITYFNEVPIKRVDALSANEALVA